MEVSNVIEFGLPPVDQIVQTCLDIISKQNLGGWFAFLESYYLGMITMALLTISLIFMVNRITIFMSLPRKPTESQILDPNSEFRKWIGEKKDSYPLSWRITLQIIDNYYSRIYGLPEKTLAYFCPNHPGYLSPNDYWTVGDLVTVRNRLREFRDPRFYKVGGFSSLFSPGDLYDRDKIGERGSPSTVAQAHPKILYAVLKMEIEKDKVK